MKNNYLRKMLTALIAITITLTSCVEKVDLDNMDSSVTLNPALALPIGSVHANMIDLLSFVDSSFINVDEKNGVYIFFEQNGLNVDFAFDQFSKGEKLSETLTLSRIEEATINPSSCSVYAFINSILSP